MKYVLLLSLVIQSSLTVKAQSFDDKAHQTLKNFIGLFPEQTQFAVALMDSEDTQFYGFIKTKDSIQPMENSNSVFQIGSVTKVFTATLLAKLVEDQRLKLTDTLQYFFDFPLSTNSITLEQLARHTSGLPRLPSNLVLASVDPQNPYKSYSEENFKNYLSTNLRQEHQPRTYQYSNLGYAILTKAMENLTSQPYSTLLQEYVFQDLEMTQSTLDVEKIQDRLVKGLDANGQPTPVWDMAQFEGAGAMLSTAVDLSKFIRAHFSLEADAFALTTLPGFLVDDNLRIGLGWHILQDDQGGDLYWHNGGTGGYSASVFMAPEHQKSVIILSNVSAFHSQSPKLDELGFQLLSLLKK